MVPQNTKKNFTTNSKTHEIKIEKCKEMKKEEEEGAHLARSTFSHPIVIANLWIQDFWRKRLHFHFACVLLVYA